MADSPPPDVSGAGSSSSASDWYARQWLRLCRMLDVEDPGAALDRVESLLHRAKADTSDAPRGLLPVDEVEDVFATMNAKLERLEDENERLLQRLDDRDASDATTTAAPTPEWEALLDVLGADSVDAVAEHVDRLTERVEALKQERDRIAADRDALRDELDAVETDRPSDALLRLAATLRDDLGVDTNAAAHTLTRRIQTMHDRLQTLQEEQAALADAVGVHDSGDVTTLIESMEAQLTAVYDAQREAAEAHRDASETLTAIRDILGVDSEAKARDLKTAVLDLLETSQEAPDGADGTDAFAMSSLAEGARMIESMEAQLNEVYQRREAEHARAPSAGIDPEMDLVDQLEGFLAEQEQLESELGVASADAVINMVQDLSDQLNVLYAERDAASDDRPVDAETAEMLVAMREQLEALYEEKEALIASDFEGAEDAVARIHTLEEDVESLQADNDRLTEGLERIRSALRTDAAPAEIANLVRTVRTRLAALAEAADTTTHQLRRDADASVHTAPPVVDSDVVLDLGRLSEAELNALDVGVLRLTPDGTITFVNDRALPVPGIPGASSREALEGRNFFEAAPGANQHPFFRRFRDRAPNRPVDDRFPHLIPQRNADPVVLLVHLHRAPNAEASWILFRPL
jgi:hypothetical protein